MKLAVTYENGQIFQHFGHCQNFKIYEVEANQVKSASVVNAGGNGHGALAAFLKSQGVGALICGGIGAGAKKALAEAGIALYPGVTGSADSSVEALLNGKLVFHPDVMCNHHHEGEHTCHSGGHTCGEDHHGCTGNH